LAVAPLTAHTTVGEQAPLHAFAAMAFFGANFHVALTGWFFTDPEMRQHLRSRPLP
jgi:hypothetical protein